jgi:hypothetical protein
MISSFAFDCSAILSACAKAAWLAGEKSDGWKMAKFRPSCLRLTDTPVTSFLLVEKFPLNVNS